jgi:hypothetical protein
MFSVEANECSGPMVFAMHAMLTTILPTYASTDGDSGANAFYPFLHFDLMDEWDYGRRMQPSFFPTRDTGALLAWIRRRQQQEQQQQQGAARRGDALVKSDNQRDASSGGSRGGGFSVQYGDFLRAYGDATRKHTFDVIVTCFFIDTFSNILEPLLVIQHILKPGGLWVNAGPLHYHGKSKIPYSFVQLERIIASVNLFQSV